MCVLKLEIPVVIKMMTETVTLTMMIINAD